MQQQDTASDDVQGPVRVRFAPSPTGYLHTGGARTALFNWLFARRNGGKFVLRIEDTDAARNTPAALAAIYDSLRWLGIDWDEGPDIGGPHGPYFQSERREIYDRYFGQLEAKGLIYTEENGAARFRSPREDLVIDDRICGLTPVKRTEEPDMTVRRPDGSYIFHFGNVVDDIEMQITHVIRGEDHLTNTAKHIELFNAFGVAPPVYAHIPLILNPDGSKMSKRDTGASVQYYQSNAYVPAAVRNYLCLLGWSPKDDREVLPIDEVMRLFRWENLNNHNAKFDLEKCRWMNAQYLVPMGDAEFIALCQAWLGGAPDLADDADPRNDPGFAALAASLQLQGDSKFAEALLLIKPKIRVANEIAPHLKMLFEASSVDAEARAKVTAQADFGKKVSALTARLSAAEAWTAEVIQSAVAAAAADCSAKPGALMFPLRFLVTGQAHGVDLLPALVLLGKDTVLDRIKLRAE